MKIALIILTLSLYFVGGCSNIGKSHPRETVAPHLTNNTMSPNNLPKLSLKTDFPTENIESIELSKYRSDSKKVQPELFNLISDPKDINVVVDWVKGIKDENVDLPDKIQALYIILVSYQDQANLNRKPIAYAVDDKGNMYAKAFSMFPDVYMDQFDENKLSALLKKIGKHEWYKVNPLTLINP